MGHHAARREELVEVAPDEVYGWRDRSYALHQMGRDQEALDLLLPAAQKFPKDWEVPYNLACYSARVGRLDEARDWLKKTAALQDAKALKSEALADPDLEPLWPEIAQIPTPDPETV